VLFGLAPSLIASRVDLAMRSSLAAPRRERANCKWFSTRGLLVSGQVALSVVLLIGAMLLIESLAHLSRVDPGFDTTNLLTMRISLPDARYDTPQKAGTFHEELVRRVEALPEYVARQPCSQRR